jgi:UDP-N-acetylmuramoylalanine--D-glutamate ligase
VQVRFTLQKWQDQQVVVLGLARQGKALVQYLSEKGARVIVNDRKPAEEFMTVRQELAKWPIEYVFGDHPHNILEGTSQVFLSGGVPLDIPIVEKAMELGIPLSNDSQLFLDLCPAKVIGITGSAGKSTTTALVGRIAELHAAAIGKHAWTGGNIGRPLLHDVEKMHSGDWAIMELSSFQLELMISSPHISVVLNVTPNHLDRHKTMKAYTEAKARILYFQSESDIAVLNRDDPVTWDMREIVAGKLLTFGMLDVPDKEGTYLRDGTIYLRRNGREEKLFELQRITLPGEHNLANVLAACAIAAGAGFSTEAIVAGLEGFSGLPHRLEFIREVHGADWYNDSIATSPERAIAAMRSFKEPIVLLAGGRDKDLPWEAFADAVSQHVDHLILFGEAAEKISRVIHERRERPQSIDFCAGLEAAVVKAAERAEIGDIVLLAPGGTSFDEFIDFAARGERFRELVEEL